MAPGMPLSVRTFRCPGCRLEMDQDLNAALNLKQYGLATLRGPTERPKTVLRANVQISP
jgi:putative transposase